MRIRNTNTGSKGPGFTSSANPANRAKVVTPSHISRPGPSPPCRTQPKSRPPYNIAWLACATRIIGALSSTFSCEIGVPVRRPTKPSTASMQMLDTVSISTEKPGRCNQRSTTSNPVAPHQQDQGEVGKERRDHGPMIGVAIPTVLCMASNPIGPPLAERKPPGGGTNRTAPARVMCHRNDAVRQEPRWSGCDS